MVALYGVRINQLPSSELLKKMLGKDWVEVWQKQHGNPKREEVAQSSLAGLFLLRFSGVDGVLAYSEKGRPYLVDSKVDFSISHTGEWIFCAVSTAESACRVGLDAESGSRLREDSLQSLAKRWFSEKEQALLGDAPDLKSFLRIWTRKESLVKWQGEGLSHLYRVDTVIAPNEYGVSFFEYQAEDVFLTLCTSAQATVSREIRFLSNAEIKAWKNANF